MMKKILIVLALISLFSFLSCEKYEYNYRQIERSIPYPIISDFDVHHYSNLQVYYACEVDKDVEDSVSDFIWDFGDGNTSKSKSGYHSYAEYGTYYVKLTATNKMGDVVNSQVVEVFNSY